MRKKWLRVLSGDVLKRLLKDNYRLGSIVIKAKKYDKELKLVKNTLDNLAERIRRNDCSYIKVFGLARDEICQTCDDPYSTFEADVDQLDKWIIAVPYSTESLKQKDFEQFRTAIANICSITDEDGCRVFSEEDPLICEPNAEEDLYQTVLKLIAGSEENPGEIYCCIESPPRSLAEGHCRYLSGDLNHIYREKYTTWP